MTLSPRATPPPRWAHLGLGAFHRAHQAWYGEVANQRGDEHWTIAAFTGRRPDAAEALRARDCRYDLVVRGPQHDEVETISSIVSAHDGADGQAWNATLATAAVVTVTITEVGYRHTDDERDRDIALMRAGAQPVGSAARLAAGLAHRFRVGGEPIAVVSCDNLDDNGAVLRTQVLDVAEHYDRAVHEWIRNDVSFVSSVVDRITPAVADALPQNVTRDPLAVITEPTTSWYLAGDFPAGRPTWEHGGAEMVTDLVPYTRRKLWLLNAGHTLLAHLGRLRGHADVASAMTDDVCRAALTELWNDATPVLPFSVDEITTERDRITARFENSRIRHSLDQIASDSALKLGVRVVPVIEERLRIGLDAGAGEVRALAAWVAHSHGATSDRAEATAHALSTISMHPETRAHLQPLVTAAAVELLSQSAQAQ